MFKLTKVQPEGVKILKLIDGVNKKAKPDIAKRLKDVTVKVKPFDIAMRTAGKYAAIRAGAALPSGSQDLSAIIEVAWCEAVGRLAIVGWDGVFPDKGKEKLPFTPENLAALLCDPDFFDAMDFLYFTPALARSRAEEDEKNG